MKDFARWRFAVRIVLLNLEVFEVATGVIAVSPELNQDHSNVQDVNYWRKKDAKAQRGIKCSLGSEFVSNIMDCGSSFRRN